MRWVFVATMNTADVGNEPLSLAFKRRFHIIRVKFTEKDLRKIVQEIYNVDDSDWRPQVAEEILSTTTTWKRGKLVLFPAGIGHVINFLNDLQNGLRDLHAKDIFGDQKYINAFKEGEFNLASMVELSLRSHVIMPIVDENSLVRVEQVEKKMITLQDQIVSIIEEKPSNLEEFKELSKAELEEILSAPPEEMELEMELPEDIELTEEEQAELQKLEEEMELEEN
jgi:hypothetical protein